MPIKVQVPLYRYFNVLHNRPPAGVRSLSAEGFPLSCSTLPRLPALQLESVARGIPNPFHGQAVQERGRFADAVNVKDVHGSGERDI